MEVFIRDKEMPKKTCENCPLCEYFDKDAHGKGKHEVACLYEGTFNNILFGDKLCPENCNIIKSLTQHDAELKAKWCDELMKWINTPYTIGCAMCLNREGFLQTDDLKQKLKEMKGEKE